MISVQGVLTYTLILILLHIISNGNIVKESKFQYELHKFYARLEPFVLSTLDKMFRSKFFAKTGLGKAILKVLAKILWFLPHGVVIDYNTAENHQIHRQVW
ncbi:MAG: hypothetical protein J7L82_05435 [Staphylothermus sp.]|nr:hypothetical protein [Staphylothermus sp.]